VDENRTSAGDAPAVRHVNRQSIRRLPCLPKELRTGDAAGASRLRITWGWGRKKTGLVSFSIVSAQGAVC
jgi:hypothetical protein